MGGVKGLSYLNLRLKYDECKMNINNVADQHGALLVYIFNLNLNLKTALHSSNRLLYLAIDNSWQQTRSNGHENIPL